MRLSLFQREVKYKMMNKKAQFESKLFAILMIFIVGITFFFLNHLNQQIYDKLDDRINDKYQNTSVDTALDKIQNVEESNIWDYAFLAIFMAIMISLMMFGFASRTNIAFYWIFVILGIIVLVLGVVVSNIWQELAEQPIFAETILRFPITNAVLGTYFPMMIVGLIFITLTIMFGKRQETI